MRENSELAGRVARRSPSTDRGRAMVQRLLRAAEICFSCEGYQAASVAAICKVARVSNGSFYQYFSDKEAIYQALIGRFRELVLGELTRAAALGYGAKGRIEAVTVVFHELLRREANLLQLFREAEFVATATSRSFYELLEAELPRLLGTEERIPASVLTDFLLGAIYFNVVSRSVWGREHQPLPTILEFVLHGMAPREAPSELWRRMLARSTLHFGPAEAPAAVKPGGRAAQGSVGELTRHRLLDAAEELFGKLGYAECTIARITEAAGVGLGTFYAHFPSKQALLERLVRRTAVRLTQLVARRVEQAPHRLGAEVLGLRSFLEFLEQHAAMYRVVREAEFAHREIGSGYYLGLAEGYRVSLERGMDQGQVRPMEPLALGLSLMGVSHFLGLRGLAGTLSEPELAVAVELMMRGVLGVLQPPADLPRSGCA